LRLDADFTGTTRVDAPELADTRPAFAPAEPDCGAKAWFEAAVALLLTPFIVLRVFWITLGLWAEARPAAIPQARIVAVMLIAGFIVSPYFFAGGAG
jgi:hypothetical protein